MPAREGDVIETRDHALWDVKGLVHPPGRLIAYPRFIPHPEGGRVWRGVRYRKVYPLAERYALLRGRYPNYLVYDPVFDEVLCEVPVTDVVFRYDPRTRLREMLSVDSLDGVEEAALKLAKIIRAEAGIGWNQMGVSGSLLTGIHTPTSDIDLIFYGVDACRRVYHALKSLREAGVLSPYTVEGLKRLHRFRSTDTEVPFRDFVKTEARKAIQGMFSGREYFMRFVKDWSEVREHYGSTRYKQVGYARIRGVVTDDSQSIFTPCVYQLGNVEVLEGPEVPVREVCSFRGRFCEQARVGEVVVAQGKLELVVRDGEEPYHRIILGGRPRDIMVPIGRFE